MIRGGIGTAVALSLLLLLSQAASAQDDIFEPGGDKNLSWISYDEAVSQAKTDYKPVMIYFFGRDGQDLCKEAETKRFKSSSVKTQAKKFAVVKVSSTDSEKLTDKFSVPPGQFAVVFLNFKLDEISRVTSEKDLKKLSSAMKKAFKENEEQNKKLRKVAEAYDKAMKYKNAKRMRECVQILEAIAKLRGEIDSPYIEKSEEYLKLLEKQGTQLLSDAERLIDQAENSLWQARRNGSRYYRQQYANDAQQKLLQVSKDCPVQSLKDRLTRAQTRLAQIASEYQRLVQEEQQRDQNK
jgi:hypothetical protein